MVRRQQVQDLRIDTQLSPRARPVDTFASPSKAGLDLVQDFAGLSSSIQDFLRAKAERDKEKQLAAGRAFAVENPQFAAQAQAAAVEDPKANRKAFRKLVEEGKIKPLQSPWGRVGYYEAAARQLVTAYQAGVSARLEETAQVVGPDGQPQEPADIEQIMQEEYAKIADNPVLQNTYGRDAAIGLREQFDAKARLAASELRLDAEDKFHRSNLTKEMAQKFDEVAMADDVTPDMLQGLSAHVQQAMTEKTVKDPRGLVLDALRLSVARARRAEGGAESALLLLEDAEQLKVEGLALRDDPETGLAIEQLRDDLIAQQDRDRVREAQKPDLEVKAAVDAREGEWITSFTETLDSGASYAADVAEEEVRLKAEVTDPKLRGILLQKLRETAKKVEESQSTTPGFLKDFQARIVAGDVEGAQAYYEAGLTDPNIAILPKDLAAMKADLAQAASLEPLIEGFGPRNEALERLKAKEQEFSQYASDVDVEWRIRVRGEVESFNRDYYAFAASLRGQPNAEQQLREFINQREVQINTETTKFREGQTQQRQEFLDQLRELNDKGQDGREFIERAFAKGKIGSQEKQHYLQQNETASDRDVLYKRESVQDAESRLYNQALNEGKVEGEPTTQQDFERASDAVFQFRRQLALWIDTNRATTDPRQFPRSLDGAVPEILDELQGTTPESSATEEALKAGKSIPEAQKIAVDLAAARQKHADWNLRLQDPAPFRGDEPLLGRHPKVKRDTYSNYGRFVQRNPVRRTERYEVEDRFASEVFKLRDDPDRDAAAMSMYRLIGVPAQAVLDGKMTVTRSRQFRETSESARTAKRAEALKRVGMTRIGSVGAFGPVNIDELLAQHAALVNESAEITVRPEDVDPYATPMWPTVQTMRNDAAQRPEKMEALRKKFNIPDDPGAIREWMQAQTDAINRNRANPEI